MQKVQHSTENKKQLLKKTILSSELRLEELAWETGFYQHAPKKITATALFISFFQMHQNGKNILRNWATEMAGLIGETVHKQSIDERLNEQAVELAQRGLQELLQLSGDPAKINKDKAFLRSIPPFFNRIMIRDSTVQQICEELYETFKGSYSKGSQTAMLRIQALLNFSQQRWEDIRIGAYTDNDQGAADCIEDALQTNDLLLQDLGYFTLDWLEQVTENQYIITNYKKNVSLFDPCGTKLNILEKLKSGRRIDQAVLVGQQKKIPMRLVARKLPAGKAKKRIRAAKKNRHTKSNHSQEYYDLLKYEIYLTNVPAHILNYRQVARTYGLRWHIEILFKSWKSYGHFKTLFHRQKMNLQRALFTIYAVMIELVYLQNYVFVTVEKEVRLQTDRPLSCLKFMDFINDVSHEVFQLKSRKELKDYVPRLLAYALYEKRTKRRNTIDKYLYVKEL